MAGIAALAVIGLVFLSVQGALAPAPESAAVTRLEIQSLTPIEEQGRQVYRQFACSVCHQINGAGGGTRGPDLAGVGAQLEPQQILSHLQPITGTSAMPTYGIDNRDVLALTAYVLTLTQPPSAPVSPTVALPRGEALYMANGCAACHAIDGAGGAIGPDLSGEGARHDAAWLIQFLQNPAVVVPGTKMPAHPLPPADAQAVADYLASTKGAAAAPSVESGKMPLRQSGLRGLSRHPGQGRQRRTGPHPDRRPARRNDAREVHPRSRRASIPRRPCRRTAT